MTSFLWSWTSCRVKPPTLLYKSLTSPSLSSTEQELHDAAGRSPQGVQLSPAPGWSDRPRPDHPGHPADRPGAQTAAGRALLPAGQADHTAVAARQSWKPLQLEDPGLHVMYLCPHKEHPQIPQVPPEEVSGRRMDANTEDEASPHLRTGLLRGVNFFSGVISMQDPRALPRLWDGSLRRIFPRVSKEDSSQRECAVPGGDPLHRGPTGHDHHGPLPWRRLLQDHHQLTHHSWRGASLFHSLDPNPALHII